ncbi:MAG: RNA polymerase sigma factor [Planctomycetota bacterium]
MTPPDLDAVYRTHAKRLVAVALQLTGSHALAEDAVQEAFVSAHKAAKSFRDESSPETWLYRIAIRAANRLRLKQDANARRDASHVRSDAHASDTGELDALRRAIDGLPEELRLVVILMNLRDLPAALVGEILNIPEGTVWSRAYRARKAMRASMSEEAVDA